MRLNIGLLIVLASQVAIWLMSGAERSAPMLAEPALTRVLGDDATLKPQSSGARAREWLTARGSEASAAQLGMDEAELKGILDSPELSADQRASLELAVAIRQVELVSITEGESSSALLKRPAITLTRDELKAGAEPSWSVVSAHGYPAQTAKINTLLSKLLKLKLKTVIGRRAENHSRLRVAKGAYDRLIKLKAGEREVIIYVGNGKRDASHVRFEGDDRVYRVKGFSTWSDLTTSLTAYVDSSYLKVDEVKAVQISGPGDRALNFTKTDAGWTLAGVQAELLDQDAVSKLIGDASALTLNEVEGVEPKPAHGFDAGLKVTLTPQDESQAPLVYQLGRDDQDHVFARTDSSRFVVQVAAYQAKDLFEKVSDDLISEEAREAQAQAEEAARAAQEAQTAQTAQTAQETQTGDSTAPTPALDPAQVPALTPAQEPEAPQE